MTDAEIVRYLIDGMRCDNPPCCNPKHLFLATHTENMRDMRAKGRAADQRYAPDKQEGK